MTSFFERRKRVVCDGIGVFNPSTAVKASNATIHNQEGKSLIDFAGGIGVVNAGHCPEPVVKAIQDQAARLIHSCFNVATYEPYLDLAELLVDLFPHGKQTKVMLTNTGAESVENAIKIARQYTKRSGILCFTGAFHGRSMMAMSLTSKVGYKKDCGPFAPEVYRIPFPNSYRKAQGRSPEAFSKDCLAELEKAFKNVVAPESLAAIIIEPVQGEGGFHVVPQAYLKGLRKICDEHGILLILDEVQSGFGRTGAWAAYQHFGVIPDLSTWAKSMGSGMPIGAVLGKAEVMDSVSVGTLGGTYLGNPVCCAAAIATIQYMKKININELGQKVGAIVKERMLQWQEKYPQQIGDVRGLGAMLAMELIREGDLHQPDADVCKEIVWKCAEKGLILLSAGTYGNVIRVLSPLTIPEEQLNEGLTILEQVLEEVWT